MSEWFQVNVGLSDRVVKCPHGCLLYIWIVSFVWRER